jgi:tRNA pseudouridine55 synthase
MKNRNKSSFPPLIFNVFKPARMTSYDVIRHFKRNLPNGFGKIGHFGTLDPFASGVLMIGIGGAARLNDFIHEFMPKTYIATGKLGIETPTGDYTSEVTQVDDSLYLKQEISQFPATFLESRFKEKFLGDYLQAPHKYSAAKFMGKNLHEWAREGVDVKKEQVLRHIYSIEVLRYAFPYLSIKVTVSSGTYVRTLFSDMCNDLGTIGSLISLVRESVGGVSTQSSLHKKDWPEEKSEKVISRGIKVQEVLPFPRFILNPAQALSFRNGAFLKLAELNGEKKSSEYSWMLDENETLLGLAQKIDENQLKPKITFHLDDLSDSSSSHSPL